MFTKNKTLRTTIFQKKTEYKAQDETVNKYQTKKGKIFFVRLKLVVNSAMIKKNDMYTLHNAAIEVQ